MYGQFKSVETGGEWVSSESSQMGPFFLTNQNGGFMYLVIGAKDKGFWIKQIADKKILLNNLNRGYYRNNWTSQTDMIFVDELPRPLEQCARMSEFKPDQVFIVECKVIKPIPVEVTTKYRLED